MLRGLYLSQQKCVTSVPVGMSVVYMVPVSPCESAEGFVFVEGPATNSVHCITYHRCLQIMLWQLGTSLTPVYSLRTLTGLTFVPAALIVTSSLKREGGVLLHS